MTTPDVPTTHVYHVCNEVDCSVCRGGLAWCTVCGGAEGSLLTTCPRYRLNVETQEACYNGNVVDFAVAQTKRDNGFDVRKRGWQR